MDDWVSALHVNDEAIVSIRDRLITEIEDAAAACGVLHGAVQANSGLVDDIILRHLDDLILLSPVVAVGASEPSVRIAFVPSMYRRIAEAAKDVVCNDF